MALAGLLVAVPLVASVTTVVSIAGLVAGVSPPDVGHDLLVVLRDAAPDLSVVLLFVSALVLAPVFEEIIFRGLVQTVALNILGPGRHWAAILIGAAVFGAIHIDVVTWQAIPALALFGVILGWLYERTGSLLPAIVTHAGFNAVNIALVLLLKPGAA
jgi:membrane protease YdiL (CAAX protease family)